MHNRVVAAGTYTAPHGFTISLLGRYNSARPVNPSDDNDLNGDGFFRDRPGPNPALGLTSHLRRNSFRGDSFMTIDLRVAKAFSLKGRHDLEIVFEVFNFTNQDNFTFFDDEFSDGNVLNPDFLTPEDARNPRSFQLGFRYRV